MTRKKQKERGTNTGNPGKGQGRKWGRNSDAREDVGNRFTCILSREMHNIRDPARAICSQQQEERREILGRLLKKRGRRRRRVRRKRKGDSLTAEKNKIAFPTRGETMRNIQIWYDGRKSGGRAGVISEEGKDQPKGPKCLKESQGYFQ